MLDRLMPYLYEDAARTSPWTAPVRDEIQGAGSKGRGNGTTL
jgi:spore coat protein U-like protein